MNEPEVYESLHESPSNSITTLRMPAPDKVVPFETSEWLKMNWLNAFSGMRLLSLSGMAFVKG